MKKGKSRQIFCPRCRNSMLKKELLCSKCKSELMVLHNHRISWELAYEIEKEEENVRSLITESR
jgi:uncharacterized paraquat-inducible protein A